MQIAILGSGNGGCAMAFDFAQHGHTVRLFDFEQFTENTTAISKNGGIHSEGQLTGFAAVEYAGSDIAHVLEGAEMIFAVGPAYSTQPFAEACKPHLRSGQTVVICPSSCGGSFEFVKAAEIDLENGGIIVAETSTLPYAVRITEPGKIRVFLKLQAGVFLAAYPAKNTLEVLNQIHDVYPCIAPATNVLQTSLQNGNPVIHPAVTLLNAALIERTGGDFFFYEEGVTPAVGRLMAAIDKERIAIGSKLGLQIIPDPELGCQQGYMQVANYDEGFSTARGFAGIKAQQKLDNRYFQEDVGFGLVFLKSLGEQLDVDVSNITALIRIVSVLMERDYLSEAPRTMSRYGLGEHSAEQLSQTLA
ncbi:Opine dehydrogenase [Novipirellula galeiformis]|uniref:Opine dehydrogenase n=1 Tax=Novipirellula galeiformis TaxID=2528004 RepID=A0A5C6CL51_9BACT|nr:NAD/NADP-dependent octopine/nopaline dehydrogenase family protein [Novipirellula galeiformis]TWU25178.1 Opine dehydrogenase [Novipirellula galeiformis]